VIVTSKAIETNCFLANTLL